MGIQRWRGKGKCDRKCGNREKLMSLTHLIPWRFIPWEYLKRENTDNKPREIFVRKIGRYNDLISLALTPFLLLTAQQVTFSSCFHVYICSVLAWFASLVYASRYSSSEGANALIFSAGSHQITISHITIMVICYTAIAFFQCFLFFFQV